MQNSTNGKKYPKRGTQISQRLVQRCRHRHWKQDTGLYTSCIIWGLVSPSFKYQWREIQRRQESLKSSCAFINMLQHRTAEFKRRQLWQRIATWGQKRHNLQQHQHNFMINYLLSICCKLLNKNVFSASAYLRSTFETYSMFINFESRIAIFYLIGVSNL